MLQSYRRFNTYLGGEIQVHIAQVCYLAPPALGGVEQHVLELSRALIRRGHKVSIHTSNFLDLKGSALPKDLSSDEIPTYRYSSKFVKKTTLFSQPIHFPSLIFGLIKTNPDIIHVHSMASMHLEICYIYAKLFKKPLVVTGHYSASDLKWLYTKRKKGKKTKRLIYWEKRLKKIMAYATLIAITEDEASAYRKLFGFSNIVVIPNGVDLKEFNPNLPREDFLLYVGRIVPEKRLDFLIDSLKLLNSKYPSQKLIIAGYAPDKDYLHSLKDSADKEIIFISPERKELVELISKAKALILPSKNEAFGIVLLEAMAGGAIPLASNSGGFPLVLDDAGLLFDPDSKEDLVEKIRLLDNKELYQTLKEKGLKRVAAFSWESVAKEIEEVYLNLVGR